MGVLEVIGARLLLGGKGLLHLLAAGFNWLLEKPIRGVLLLFALFSAAHQFVIDPRLRHERDAEHARAEMWKANAGDWTGAYKQFAANVKKARQDAEAADRANVARISREYQAINERTRNDLEARNSDTRAALVQLRDSLALAGSANRGEGGSGPADVPAAFTARCQAFGAADCDALLAALPDRFAAAEDNTSKLIELQDYVRSSLLLDFSGTGR